MNSELQPPVTGDEGNITLFSIGLLSVLLMLVFAVLGVSQVGLQRNQAQDRADILAMVISEAYSQSRYYDGSRADMWTQESLDAVLGEARLLHRIEGEVSISASIEDDRTITLELSQPVELEGFGAIFAPVLDQRITVYSSVLPLDLQD